MAPCPICNLKIERNNQPTHNKKCARFGGPVDQRSSQFKSAIKMGVPEGEIFKYIQGLTANTILFENCTINITPEVPMTAPTQPREKNWDEIQLPEMPITRDPRELVVHAFEGMYGDRATSTIKLLDPLKPAGKIQVRRCNEVVAISPKHFWPEVSVYITRLLDVPFANYAEDFERILSGQSAGMVLNRALSTTTPLMPISLSGFIYVLKTAHFISTGEEIYKVGRTFDFEKRLGGYPKGSKMLAVLPVKNIITAEKDMLAEMRLLCKPRIDHGAEYFEGEFGHVIGIFHNISKTHLP